MKMKNIFVYKIIFFKKNERELHMKVDEPILFPRKFLENCNTKIQLKEEIRKKAKKLEAPSASKFKSHDGHDALVMNINVEHCKYMALK